MRTKKLGIFLVLPLFLLASLACSLSGLLPAGIGGGSGGSASGTTIADLWPDVPKMSGMTRIQQDVPVEIQLAVQAFFSAASNSQGSVNFIAYSTSQSTAQVVSYYSPERMKAAGWDSVDQSGCIADTSATSTVQGGLCLFSRDNKDNSGALLAIVPTYDSTSKTTSVFFGRIDVKNVKTPTP